MYSQNNEEEVIINYFKGTGKVLDIGANDGKTLSNSLKLVELGWEAVLVEPANKAFSKLTDLHKGNSRVQCVKAAIGKASGILVLHESGELLGQGDSDLVSTLIPKEKERWNRLNMAWSENEVEVIDIETLFDLYGRYYDFITIDAEGLDFEILSQIDLTNTKMVCVEHNGIETDKYKSYCEKFGLKEVLRNQENIIMAR